MSLHWGYSKRERPSRKELTIIRHMKSVHTASGTGAGLVGPGEAGRRKKVDVSCVAPTRPDRVGPSAVSQEYVPWRAVRGERDWSVPGGKGSLYRVAGRTGGRVLWKNVEGGVQTPYR